MTSTSKNVYIDKSDNIVNECNNNTIEQLTWNQLMLKKYIYWLNEIASNRVAL